MPSWIHFERLVAALYYTETQGAIVKWNEKIGGRQFDVTVRFKYGIHRYLTVIECKDYSERIPVEKVEAFIIKARDAKADKAVIISSKGFQKGCVRVSEQHNITLLTLEENFEKEDLLPQISIAIDIYNVKIFFQKKCDPFNFSNDQAKLKYQINQGKIFIRGMAIGLSTIFKDWKNRYGEKFSRNRKSHIIKFPINTSIQLPDEERLFNVDKLEFDFQLVDAIVFPAGGLDAHLHENKYLVYQFRDANGTTIREIRKSKVQHGFDTKIKVGKFYSSPNLGFFYYCKEIDDDSVSWILIESYQHGQLIQVEFKQTIEAKSQYVEVTDQNDLDRLNERLKPFLKTKK